MTITQNGMAKRSKLGSGSKVLIEDENGNPVLDDEGEQNQRQMDIVEPLLVESVLRQ